MPNFEAEILKKKEYGKIYIDDTAVCTGCVGAGD